MVWEKKKYFLSGIRLPMGTSFTPSKTSHWLKSEVTLIPASRYSLSVKTRFDEGSTKIVAFGKREMTFWQAWGERTTRLSGGVLRSFIIPKFMKSLGVYGFMGLTWQ